MDTQPIRIFLISLLLCAHVSSAKPPYYTPRCSVGNTDFHEGIDCLDALDKAHQVFIDYGAGKEFSVVLRCSTSDNDFKQLLRQHLIARDWFPLEHEEYSSDWLGQCAGKVADGFFGGIYYGMKVGNIISIPLCTVIGTGVKGMSPAGALLSFFDCYFSIVAASTVVGAEVGTLIGLAQGVYLAFWFEADTLVFEFIFVK